ncbi:Leucine-rich repeat protein [Klebsormidium nitens]|uniref:Leucine-rich repeat protein n=1 Tax=Klebsormidium nitens TaxID=105231 RepID=A0A1Y1IWC3_KLENI|nr:Leucine-rich repeat protein [Klebsormidium nitens]|eukprot:GAQ92578.1 Leucine-rich repeat protein [Klebsormidium nitens]
MDGVLASVYFLVNQRGPPKEDRKVTIHPEQRVVGLDPGKSPDFLTGVTVRGDWNGIEHQSGDIHFETKEFYHLAGFKKRTFLMSRWMARDVDVAWFNERAQSGDGLGLEEFGRRVTAVTGSMYALIRFHTARRVRKLRRRVTVEKQREVDRVCADITGGKVVVVVPSLSNLAMGCFCTLCLCRYALAPSRAPWWSWTTSRMMRFKEVERPKFSRSDGMLLFTERRLAHEVRAKRRDGGAGAPLPALCGALLDSTGDERDVRTNTSRKKLPGSDVCGSLS